MFITTTGELQGAEVQYIGIVAGEAIMGTNFVKDFFSTVTDTVGGRSRSYENSLRQGRDIALREMSEQAEELGATAVIGVNLDYEVLGKENGMMMVVASGTAVIAKRD